MQVKVIIGTVAFMLAMIILGVIALFEPARLQDTTEAYAGRQVEKGAALFNQNCSTCHGIEGKAESCFDAAGEEIACVGLPLNRTALLCGDPSERMVQMGWKGSKEAFIHQTIAAGRPPTLMPTWSQAYGGPMEDYQIDEVVAYVLNWGADPDLCGEGAVVEAVEWPAAWDELPSGEADNGPALYQSYACNSCHGQPDGSVPAAVGPNLGNIGNVAATRIEGMSAEQYIYESIYMANAFVVEECPTGPCGVPSAMAAQGFENRMSQQDMADLIAYYMTLKSE
jgi:mono/diheme cytochrome c family protein